MANKLSFYDDDRMGWGREVTMLKENEAAIGVGDYYVRDSGTVGRMGEFKIRLADFSSIYGNGHGGHARPFSRPVAVQATVFGDGLKAFEHLLAAAKRRRVDLLADIPASDMQEARKVMADRLLACGLRDQSKEQFPTNDEEE